MKRLFHPGGFIAAFILMLFACGTPPAGVSPGQQVLNQAGATCKNINATIAATDAAVVQGILKGNDARNALKGLTAAQAGCEAAFVSIQSANAPASGAKP